MSTTNPFDILGLNGDGRFRSVTLALPTDRVRQLLPTGIELGDQDVTESGTHPVIISFNILSRVRTSLPTLMPTLNYSEYTFGIPYSYTTRGLVSRESPGPYYFMPRLFLDSFLAVMGGVMFWGYAKQSANFEESEGRTSISSMSGEKLTSLSWQAQGGFAGVDAYEKFEPIRRMLDQPLVSLLPAALGPFPVVAPFEKQWAMARVRPLETVLTVTSEFITGFAPGRYPATGKAPGIDVSILGSYEYVAPWRLGTPFPPMMAR